MMQGFQRHLARLDRWCLCFAVWGTRDLKPLFDLNLLAGPKPAPNQLPKWKGTFATPCESELVALIVETRAAELADPPAVALE